MSEMRIKTERLPERCEICHQIDQFDPLTNHCSRCAVIVDPKTSQVTNNSLDQHVPVHNAPGLRQEVTLGRDTQFETTVRRSLSQLDNGILRSVEQMSQEQFFYRIIIFGTGSSAIAGAVLGFYLAGPAQLIGGLLLGSFLGLCISALLASILWPVLQNLYDLRAFLRSIFQNNNEKKRLRGLRKQEKRLLKKSERLKAKSERLERRSHKLKSNSEKLIRKSERLNAKSKQLKSRLKYLD